LKDAETESAIKQKIFGYRVARSLLTSLLLPLQFFLKEPKLQPLAVPLRNYIMRVSLLATFVVAVTIAMFPVYTSGQTQTTYSTETSNNTSACGSGAKESHCTGTGNTYGPGSNGFSSTSGTYIPEPGNVSHADIHPLITGFNANAPGAPLVFVHYLPWFCTTGSPTCNGHVLTGYASNSTTTVTNQVNDIVSRGFDGIVVNWYGKPTGTPNSSCPNGPVHCIEDETTKKVIAAVAGTNLKMILNYDQGSFGSCGSSDATCIENHIFTDFTYANTTYFGHSSYLLSGSHPVLQTFVAETQYFGSCTSSAPCTLATGVHCTSTTDCWQKIWTDAVNHSGDGSPAMIFRDNQGGIATFTHVESWRVSVGKPRAKRFQYLSQRLGKLLLRRGHSSHYPTGLGRRL